MKKHRSAVVGALLLMITFHVSVLQAAMPCPMLQRPLPGMPLAVSERPEQFPCALLATPQGGIIGMVDHRYWGFFWFNGPHVGFVTPCKTKIMYLEGSPLCSIIWDAFARCWRAVVTHQPISNPLWLQSAHLVSREGFVMGTVCHFNRQVIAIDGAFIGFVNEKFTAITHRDGLPIYTIRWDGWQLCWYVMPESAAMLAMVMSEGGDDTAEKGAQEGDDCLEDLERYLRECRCRDESDDDEQPLRRALLPDKEAEGDDGREDHIPAE